LGAAAVLMLQAGASLDGQVIVGDAMFLTAAVMWAGYTVLARRYGLDPLHSTAIVAVVSAVLYLPVYVLFLTPGIAGLSWPSIAMQVGWQGIVTSIISLLAFSAAIRLIGASKTAALTALVPAAALLLAIPVLGEVPSLGEVAGVVLGMAGVALASGAITLPRRRDDEAR
jgi:drug/metabolite transporter (DMT)-like permease